MLHGESDKSGSRRQQQDEVVPGAHTCAEFRNGQMKPTETEGWEAYVVNRAGRHWTGA